MRLFNMDRREKMLLAEKLLYIAGKYSQYISVMREQLDNQLAQITDERLRVSKLRNFKNTHLRDAERELETVITLYLFDEIEEETSEEENRREVVEGDGEAPEKRDEARERERRQIAEVMNRLKRGTPEERDIAFYIAEMERLLETLEREIDSELGGES